MIIGNFRSAQDREAKQNLQKSLLEVEIANETEREKRQKDFKNPYKPAAVPPQFKTNAEMQKDRLEQEKQAIANMNELGFDYQKGAELTSWLSSSLINKLVAFNANFKGIKKELTETTNPKLLNLDYLKNYLERYFEDMDINYGRKFGKTDIGGTPAVSTIDELTEYLPDIGTLRKVRKQLDIIFTHLADNKREITAQTNSALQKKAELEQQGDNTSMIEKQINIAVKDFQKLSLLQDDVRTSQILLDLYIAFVPSNEILNLIKMSLTQQERADLIRRYMPILKQLNIITNSGINEIEQAIARISGVKDVELLIRKLINSLSFLTNDAKINQLTKLQRDYETLLENNGKTVNLGQIKRLNDIQDAEIQKYREDLRQNVPIDLDIISSVVLKNIPQDTELKEKMEVELTANEEKIAELVLEKQVIWDEAVQTLDAYASKNINPDVIADEGERKKEVKRQAEEKKIIEAQANQQMKYIDSLIKKLKTEATVKYGELDKKIEAEEKLQQEAMEQQQLFLGEKKKLKKIKIITKAPLQPPLAIEKKLAEINSYYENFYKEINELYRSPGNKGRITASLQNYINDRFKNEPNVEEQQGRNYDSYWGYLNGQLKERVGRLLDALLASGELINADPKQTAEAMVYMYGAQHEGRETRYGIGIKDKLQRHFNEDKRYLLKQAREAKNIKRILTDHIAETEPIERQIENSLSGNGLNFKHTRIKVGRGITAIEQPQYKTFGKYVIHYGHLIDRNIANFKYPSLGSIPAIKPVNITDDYKDFLIDTLNSGKANERALNKLSNDEKKHFERVVIGAGLLETFNLKRGYDGDEKKDSDRFILLRGEVMAGNNNDKLLKELRLLIIKLMSNGRIQRNEGTNMLIELSAI